MDAAVSRSDIRCISIRPSWVQFEGNYEQNLGPQVRDHSVPAPTSGATSTPLASPHVRRWTCWAGRRSAPGATTSTSRAALARSHKARCGGRYLRAAAASVNRRAALAATPVVSPARWDSSATRPRSLTNRARLLPTSDPSRPAGPPRPSRRSRARRPRLRGRAPRARRGGHRPASMRSWWGS